MNRRAQRRRELKRCLRTGTTLPTHRAAMRLRMGVISAMEPVRCFPAFTAAFCVIAASNIQSLGSASPIQ
jgi:hypothetical protein